MARIILFQVLDGILENVGAKTCLTVDCAGVGTAAAYIGSLFYMMRGVAACGLPDKEQTRAMVTSLWICCDCLGGCLGATCGSFTFDRYDFQTSTMIMAGLALLGVLVISLYGLQIKKFHYRTV